MEHAFYVRLGARIRELRTSRGVTQEGLAQRLGRNRTTVVNIERGRQGLAVHQLVEIAAVLGCDPEDLLADDVGDATPGETFVARIRARALDPRSDS
jgi:transcriptional regulator with XRE-family HTH domain